MKTYKNKHTLLFGLLMAISVIPLAVQAESEARLLIHHRITQTTQTNSQAPGQMQVEIINPGPAALNAASIGLENQSNLQILPSRLPLGNLEPSQAKSVNLAFLRLAPDQDIGNQALVWRIDYQDQQGKPQQLRILDGSLDAPPASE